MKIERNKIYNIDCLDGMKNMDAASVDMILADLPYGVLDTKNENLKWDVKLPIAKLWEHYARIIKPNGAIVLTATHPFTVELINHAPKGFKYYEMIWYKSSGTNFLNAKKQPIRQHENILVFYQKTPTYNPQKYTVDERFVAKGFSKKKANSGKMFNIRGRASERYEYKDTGERYPDSVIQVPELAGDGSVLPVKSAWRVGMHPTEKPVALFDLLIRTYTGEGELVLDNTIGSGTTAVAVIGAGRDFIGFEKDAKFYNMALERISQL